ncbi:MAG TPA: imidazolonepropionase [Acidimicrobiales bacterium]|nr:imidazolonepropionase [Acidimicrobiales bacterium]
MNVPPTTAGVRTPTPGDLLVRRASRVLTNGPDPVVEGPAAVLIQRGRVQLVVPETELLDQLSGRVDVAELDAAGGAVIPGFVDAHTHLVFAGDRAGEFEARLEGRPYEAGGIMRTVEATRAAEFEELVAGIEERAALCVDTGTTTIEVKSGYGLETTTEKRCLEAVHRAGRMLAAEVELVPTFLGAHLNPDPGYVDRLIEEMLPECAPLATSCDAFCDTGALTIDEARRVLEAGKTHGLIPRIHAEQLDRTGAAVLAAELGCASADHLVQATEGDAKALAAAGVVAVLLPAASFSMRSSYAGARLFLDAGGEIALATDCNPGTSFTTSMPFVIALACSAYGLSATEAVRAATLGGARALRRGDIGVLTAGARGDLIVIGGDSWVDLAYHPGMDVITNVVKEGRVVR